MFVGRVEVIDPDQGDNGKMQLSVMPPLDRLVMNPENWEGGILASVVVLVMMMINLRHLI